MKPAFCPGYVAALPLIAVLAACGSDREPDPAPSPTASATAAGPRTLVPAGFNDQELGPPIVGPQGPEVSGTVEFEGRTIAEVTSFVACPVPDADAQAVAADECVPEEQPDDAVYTYVHRVTPADGANGPVTLFRTSRTAAGFANNIGFDREQAEAALGEGYSIGVQTDNGALIWRIEAGDGWTAGEEINLFWQSTLPPEGPAEAYMVETAEGMANVTGPFPPAESPDAQVNPGAD